MRRIIYMLLPLALLLTACDTFDSSTNPNPTIIASFSWEPAGGTSIRLTNSSQGGGKDNFVHWLFGNGQEGTGESVIHDYRTCGSWIVTMDICPTTKLNATNCRSAQQLVTVAEEACGFDFNATSTDAADPGYDGASDCPADMDCSEGCD